MAYGSPRRRREYEPAIRDVLEDAARDAGLSVEEFLDHAVSEQEDASYRRRPAMRRSLRVVDDEPRSLEGLERRISRAPRQQDEMSEERVARILGRAFDEIRASEERTAELIKTMSRGKSAGQRQDSRQDSWQDSRQDNRRLSTARLADDDAPERRASRDMENVVPLQTPRSGGRDFDDAISGMNGVVTRLQSSVLRHEVDNALKLLEKKLTLLQPQNARDQIVLEGMAAEIQSIRAVVQAEGADVPLTALEAPIASLTQRISAMASAPASSRGFAASPDIREIDRRLDDISASTAAMISGIHDEITRLARSGEKRDDQQMNSSFNRLDTPIQQLEHASREPLEHIRQQLDILGRKSGGPAETRALQESIVQIEQKLERLTGRISQPLEMVHNALTKLSHQPKVSPAAEGRFDQLFGELSELKRGIAGQSTAELHWQLAEISDRIEKLGTRMRDAEAPTSGAGGRDVANDELLDQKIDRLSGRIAQPLQMVHNAVTQLNRQQAAVRGADGKLDKLFHELAEIKNGMGSQSTAELQQQLAKISERMESLSVRMEDGEAAPRDPNRRPIDDEIAELKRLISLAKSPCDDTKVLEAIAHLERKIAALEGSPQALLERLDRLQERLEASPATGAGAQPLPANIEVLLRNLAARLETPQFGPAVDEAGLDKLHNEIKQLSSKMEQMPTSGGLAPAVQDLSAVERAISDLFRQIDGIKSEVGEKAARAAAEAIRELNPAAFSSQSAPQVKADTSDMEASIGQLRQMQSEAEQRTTRTLEALHDTLHRVVDRLGSMESQARAPIPAPQPIPAAAVAQVHAGAALSDVWQGAPVAPGPLAAPMRDTHDDALRLVPADILAEPRQMQAPAQAPQPDAQAQRPFADTLAALRAGRTTGEPVAAPAPEPKSTISSAFAAARTAMANLRPAKAEAQNQSTAGEAPAQELAAVAPTHANPSFAPSIELDVPLEPSSARPRPGANRPSQGMAGPQAAPGDAKAEFLAAARRAAQSAAQQSASVLAEADPKARRRAQAERAPADLVAAGESAKGTGFKAKHAMLLGLAALIVAAGAGYQFMAAPKRAEAPVSPPPRTSSLTPQQLALPQQTASLQNRQENRQETRQEGRSEARVADAPAPRQILPLPLSASAPPASEPTPRLAAVAPQTSPAVAPVRVDEPVSVGSILAPARVPSSAVPPINPDDPLLRFEGLREAPKLRDAARKGDPSAFIELGMRYAEGRGAVRDPKTAALWFERAAEFGSAPAQYRLGTMHREGRGVERNPKAALKHFQAAADAGNARAMHNTAVLLAEGVNGAPDYAGAGEWFKKSAEFGIRDSQYNLAILYARGLGVGQDLMASYAWFAAAAANGDEDAAKKRDEVGGRLSPERLQQARAAAAQWKPKTPDPLANEVMAPAGGWDTEAKQVPAGANAPKAAPKRS